VLFLNPFQACLNPSNRQAMQRSYILLLMLIGHHIIVK